MEKIAQYLERIGRGAGKVVGILYQAGRDSIDQVIVNIIPFMAFIALVIGIINETGIVVEQIVLQDVNPPDPVKPAFNEVNQAIQERERLINDAWAEYNKAIPREQGEEVGRYRRGLGGRSAAGHRPSPRHLAEWSWSDAPGSPRGGCGFGRTAGRDEWFRGFAREVAC